ncbi:MAG: hypothetical protein ACRDYX_20595 [Egibacteraceae bacterium]
MTAPPVIVAVAALVAGALLHAWAARRSEARANAVLESLSAARVARFPTGYARADRGGRRVLP